MGEKDSTEEYLTIKDAMDDYLDYLNIMEYIRSLMKNKINL